MIDGCGIAPQDRQKIRGRLRETGAGGGGGVEGGGGGGGGVGREREKGEIRGDRAGG